MAGAIINKVLHDPIIFLKDKSDKDDLQMRLDMVHKIFKLDQ